MKMILVGLALLTACDAKKGDDSKPASAAKAPEAPAVVAAPAAAVVAAPAIDGTARQLFDDYAANEIRADDKYKGKFLRVSGTIWKIGKDVLDTPYVELATGDAVYGVQCMFGDTGALATLDKGQVISVRCKGDGKLGNVILRSCAIDLEIPSDPNAFIPDPGKGVHITVDLGGKEATPEENKAIAEAAVAVRNHCRSQPIKTDPLGDLWNTANLVARRSGGDFIVTVTFDDRRKSVHRGRSPRVEVNAKLTRIRALNADARELCDL